MCLHLFQQTSVPVCGCWPRVVSNSVYLNQQGRKPTVSQSLVHPLSFQLQNLPFGIPRRCCSLEKPLKVAFKAWDIISLLLGVNSGTSAHSISARQKISYEYKQKWKSWWTEARLMVVIILPIYTNIKSLSYAPESNKYMSVIPQF